jgi:septal ring factor EnvC (AmiA/AmiB activator)
MKQAIIFLFLLISTFSSVHAQSLKELQEQRKKTEESIALTNKMLKKNSKSKHQELSNLKLLSRKITYREKLITDISKETTQLEKIISEKELTIGSYNTDLEMMKANYAELIQYIWTRRSSYDQMMYVLAGEDVGQIYRRFRYLNEFSAYQKSQALRSKKRHSRNNLLPNKGREMN